MADKRITTVDEMTNPEGGADFLLVVRGTQRDLRRLRINLLPLTAFDLHDDVDTEVTSLAGADRILVSDEGTPGAPNRFAKLSTLRSFLTNAFGFDLHDDVPTELTTAVGADRLLISDESEAGDPQKWISFANAKRSFGIMSYEVLASEYNYQAAIVAQDVAHSLGRPPVMIFPVLVCKTAQAGYSVGDEIYVSHWQGVHGGANTAQDAGFVITARSATSVSFVFGSSEAQHSRPITIPRKTDANTTVTITSSYWKVKAMIVG